MMRERRWLFLLLLFFLFDFVDAWSQEPGSDLVQRGQYIFSLAGGCACHSVPEGTENAGGRAFPIPFGTVYSTNITQDKDTGIGDWKREDIAELLLTGTKPDLDDVEGLMAEVVYGTAHGFKDMKRQDALAITDHLKSLPAIKNKTK